MTSRSWSILCLVLISGSIAGVAIPARGCDCGPDFCLGDARYPGKLQAKKAAMTKNGHPPDLVALMDKDGACVARVERAPDGFSIKTIKGNVMTMSAWSKVKEDDARAKLLAGALDAYYKFNAARVFECCGEKKAEDRPDWDSNAGVSTHQAIKCTKADGQIVCR